MVEDTAPVGVSSPPPKRSLYFCVDCGQVFLGKHAESEGENGKLEYAGLFHRILSNVHERAVRGARSRDISSVPVPQARTNGERLTLSTI